MTKTGPRVASVACGLGKELALDVVDDDRVAPGEKLGGCKKPLAASGRGDDEKVSKFPAGLDGFDAKHVVEVADAENQARLLVKGACHEACKLVEAGKAGGVKIGVGAKRGLKPVESNQKAESKLLDSG